MNLLMLLLACNNSNKDTSSEPSIDAIVTLLSLNNRPQIEIPVMTYFDYETRLTEEDGSVTVPISPNQPFVITAEENDSVVHRFTGFSADKNLALDALFLDRGSWQSMLANQEITEEIGVGHLWVAIVNTNFLPIEGASANVLSSESAPPFVLLQTNIPWATNTIEPDGKEWVFFANLQPQEVSVSILAPNDQQCVVFANGDTPNQYNATIYANTATIVWFICT